MGLWSSHPGSLCPRKEVSEFEVVFDDVFEVSSPSVVTKEAISAQEVVAVPGSKARQILDLLSFPGLIAFW